MTVKRVLVLAAAVVALASACSIAPTSKQDVCDEFRELGKELASASGIYANAVFRQAGDLSSVASRYEGGDSLKSDADALDRISDSKETDSGQLRAATGKIAALCGHSLTVTAFTGSG